MPPQNKYTFGNLLEVGLPSYGRMMVSGHVEWSADSIDVFRRLRNELNTWLDDVETCISHMAEVEAILASRK